MAPPASELGARPPRVPKLTYRNRLPDDQTSISSQNSSTSQSTWTASCSRDTLSEQRLPMPITTAEPTARPSSDSRTTASSSASTSAASSDCSTSRESKTSSTTKKKKNGVFNFLSLKEPSQLALEQFAESQRKQAATKGSIPSSAGVQAISPQKLPANVPKVNSKWDGIPESVKSSRHSIMSSTSKRTSTSSQESCPLPSYSYNTNTSMFSVASDGSRDPPNSLASPMSSVVNISRRRDSGLSETETPRAGSPVDSSLPEASYFFSKESGQAEILPALPETPTGEHPWSPPPPPPPDAALEAFSFDDSELDEQLASSDHDVGMESVDSKADAIFKKLRSKGDAGFLAGEAQQLKLDEDQQVPDTHDFLFEAQPLVPPATAQPPARPVQTPPSSESPARIASTNFSRPRMSHTPSHPSRAVTAALPTLYEVSIASTDTITDRRRDSDEMSIAPSIATSVTPSEMSASWYRSSRDRLGLGGRLRKTDVLPWEDEAPGKRRSRLSVFYRSQAG